LLLEVHIMRPMAAIATAGLIAIAPLPAAVAQQSPAPAPQAGAPSVTPPNMDAVPKLDQEGIRQVQEALRRKNFDPGPIDGVLGPQTREAVRKFQDFYGMKATGEIDNQTLYALGERGLVGQP
jgi:peptidoglycan hydrolase-like protein with peptidoglycan-binding domain